MTKPLVCKLTTPELQQRKRTILKQIREAILEQQEITNGIILKLNGSDQILDLATSFIKTERMCCDFFTFELTVEDAATGFVWLSLTGPDGTREFIKSELGF